MAEPKNVLLSKLLSDSDLQKVMGGASGVVFVLRCGDCDFSMRSTDYDAISQAGLQHEQTTDHWNIIVGME